ncbi:MAG: diguanylate cyclase (GGDEF)-like protein, partial [Kiritimatiellia bacterium]
MNIDVGYKLLMVEDSTIDRRVYNRLLANTSLIFTLIVEAPSIADAVEAMKADDFDVVLVDYCLPDGNGLEFTQRLNVDMLSRPLAIIALTSHHEQKLAVEWMKGGAHDFLVKEKISPKALEHALRQAMEKAYLQHEVSFMATHDSLTQAVNRRCLVDRLQLAINSHARDGACFSVIYIDIDRFKFINDNYGHSVGDEMLVTMVERVKSVVRVNDTIGRLGGDEFLLIIENTNTINIEYILQKILISMEETPVIDGQEIP